MCHARNFEMSSKRSHQPTFPETGQATRPIGRYSTCSGPARDFPKARRLSASMTQLLRYAPQRRKRTRAFLPVVNTARLFARVTGTGRAKRPSRRQLTRFHLVVHGETRLLCSVRGAGREEKAVFTLSHGEQDVSGSHCPKYPQSSVSCFQLGYFNFDLA